MKNKKQNLHFPLAVLFASIGLLYGCEQLTPLKVDPESIILYSEGTCLITTNNSSATFSSEDDFYASVDETGLVTANRIGETTIEVSGNSRKKTIPVIVLSRYSLYPDLDVLIGKGESTVKEQLGSSFSVNKEQWIYDELTTYASVAISFDNGIVDNAIALVSTSYTTMLADALNERYSFIGMQNDFYFFLNHDENVVIELTVYNAYYLAVLYMKYSPSKGSEELPIEAFEEAMKMWQKDNLIMKKQEEM